MKPGLCCDDCVELIAKRSPTAARLWMDLCEIQTRCKVFALKIEDNPPLALLEFLGFITTTDQKSPDGVDMIVIRTHGGSIDPLGIFFCGGSCV